MIGASNHPGDTLVACHFPVVPLPTWQLPVQELCNPTKRPSKLCSVGLTRAVSLPEQDTLNREHAFTGGHRPFSSSYCSLNEDRTEEEGTSDSSGRNDSTSSPEETSSLPKKESPEARGSQRLHNSFLPNTGLDDDEEDEDSDGDNLHKYHEDSSFVLHGNSNWPVNFGVISNALSHEDVNSEWGNEGTMLGSRSGQEWLSNRMDSQLPECRCSHQNRSGMNVSPCLEQDTERQQDDMFCSNHGQQQCFPELQSNSHTEYVSDSSCNSSDGILVNFCTIYDRSNNPATPYDLSSPMFFPDHTSEGSVFLNLQPVPQGSSEQNVDRTVHFNPEEEASLALPGSHWSPQGLDSNCNLYSLEPLPPGLSSLEVSDLVACLQSQSMLAMGTNQKYYKLVSCDLSSQSPSPACSSITSCPEAQARSSPFLTPTKHKSEGQRNEIRRDRDDQTQERRLNPAQLGTGFDSSCSEPSVCQFATTSTDTAFCRRQHKDIFQNISHTSHSSQHGTYSSKCQEKRVPSTQPSADQDQEHNHTDPSEMGACSLAHSSKPKRPTSLPIQPFVLLPPEKPESQAQHLGCLLDQYINQKRNKSENPQPEFEFKVKRSQCLSNLQSSLMDNQWPIYLEAPSTSDSCSTCTPSPENFDHRNTWNRFFKSERFPTTAKGRLARVQDNSSPTCSTTQSDKSLTSNNQSNIVQITTNQDLVTVDLDQSHSSPESTSLTQTSTPCTSPRFAHDLRVTQLPPIGTKPQQKAPADSSFLHNNITVTIPAEAPLSSFSSLLSLAASGLRPQRILESARLISKTNQHSDSLVLSDRPPTEFFLSPDTNYESMSISHLQRRGLLRNVSSAVDLIMAHFGSSRDPEEKMRLGNSSYSPTIAGLVIEHLCPAIQKILEDGLRDHKLDFIIGQRYNHSWSVVEISTTIGPSTKVLHSLVSKIRQCPQLSSNCMRLRAFIMGLLNLRALEFWLSHLQSQKDVVTTHYHSWGFLFVSLDSCQPLFHELLLLLQPLSVLPFDLNLLLEPRLLHHRVGLDGTLVSPLQPCSALLVTSWPKLQADRKMKDSDGTQKAQLSTHKGREGLGSQNPGYYEQQLGGLQASRPQLVPIPEFLPKQSELEADLAEAVDFRQNQTNTWFQRKIEQDCERQHASPHQSSLRWAKLFGAADNSKTAGTCSQHLSGAQSRRLPSQWLHLDRSQLELLAQSIRSLKPGGTQPHKEV